MYFGAFNNALLLTLFNKRTSSNAKKNKKNKMKSSHWFFINPNMIKAHRIVGSSYTIILFCHGLAKTLRTDHRFVYLKSEHLRNLMLVCFTLVKPPSLGVWVPCLDVL